MPSFNTIFQYDAITAIFRDCQLANTTVLINSKKQTVGKRFKRTNGRFRFIYSLSRHTYYIIHAKSEATRNQRIRVIKLTFNGRLHEFSIFLDNVFLSESLCGKNWFLCFFNIFKLEEDEGNFLFACCCANKMKRYA